MQAAHHFLRAALEHLDDRALRFATKARRLDAHGESIAVHDFAHLHRGQVDGGGAIIGQQLTIAIARALHRADDQAGNLFAQAILAAAIQHHLAALHQLRKLLLGLHRAGRTELRRNFVETQRPGRLAQDVNDRGFRGLGRARGSPAARLRRVVARGLGRTAPVSFSTHRSLH